MRDRRYFVANFTLTAPHLDCGSAEDGERGNGGEGVTQRLPLAPFCG
jgi:hypothetical protein